VQNLPEFYHVLAVVQFVGEGDELYLEDSRIFLIPKERVAKAPRRISKIGEFEISQNHIDFLFPQ